MESQNTENNKNHNQESIKTINKNFISLSINNNKKRLKEEIRKNNPSFSKFNLSSYFIFESILYEEYLNDLKDKNSMKPNLFQFNTLKNLYNEIKDYNLVNTQVKHINIKKEFYIQLFNPLPIKIELDNISQKVHILINEMEPTASISIRKLASIFKKKYNYIISKSKIHYIMRNKLKYKFLKTSVKNNKTLSISSKKQQFFFLKIICRTLLLKGELIFIDESGFYNYNSNFRTWRKPYDKIYQIIKENGKFNLIMAVNRKKIFHFKMNNESTDSNTFKKFMEEMLQKMTQEEIKNSVFVLDNLISHKTLELYKFYSERKLKILFNAPYISEFNMIEFFFRYLKNITYKKLYSSINELKKDLLEIINEPKSKEVLEKIYKETLGNYISFYNENKNLNFNT